MPINFKFGAFFPFAKVLFKITYDSITKYQVFKNIDAGFPIIPTNNN